jgi:hypothetical protein
MDEGVEHDDMELLSFTLVESSSDIIEYLEIFIWIYLADEVVSFLGY